jgi:hypothetical protein
VGAITTQPPGLINSSFLAYQNGYAVTDTLFPGKGYWAKMNGQVQMIMSR